MKTTISPEVWAELIKRADGRCQNCGAENDLMPCHFVPTSLGGSDKVDNLWLGCFTCHRQQHDGYLDVKFIGSHYYFKRKNG